MGWSENRTIWGNAALFAWLGVGVLLLWVVAVYAAYAADVVAYPFGLDYSEGLIWQQALWITGPHMYGDISRYPFLVFEYPPLYHLAVRALATTGLDMLFAGRALSLAATIMTAGLIGAIVHHLCRGFGRVPAAAAAFVAVLLPFTLAPVVAWSPLMRVDMLGMALTYGGIALAVRSFRNPAWLYAAMLCFVAACYTKQTFIAAPAAALLVQAVRNPRLAARAGAAGFALGGTILAALCWHTNGGFLRHILFYNINRFSLHTAISHTLVWILAYPVFAILTAGSVILCWRRLRGQNAAPVATLIRHDELAATFALFTAYLATTIVTLAFAGKSGASINYFIEFMCLWCVWIGWAAGLAVHWASSAAQPCQRLAACLPIMLATQLAGVPRNLTLLHSTQLSPAHAQQAASLLERVRHSNGLLLSDDMVLVRRVNREVGLEPAILAELAANGRWDENKLIRMLQDHEFAAVVTAYGPGDPTFDARFLPRTRATLLAAYPRVETFGDYRLRLP
jgi:hypothetical protein